jgi:DNA-directed RNA polymerase subunit N (RpoN/RPB10)
MIIPVRCYTCGKLISNKYNHYENELRRKKLALNSNTDPLIININANDIKKTIAGEILDELGLTRLCCRKVMLTSINIIEEI